MSILDPKTPLELRFWKYHSERPHILDAFMSVCEDLLHDNKRSYGAKAVAEIVRRDRTYNSQPITIHNDYVSCYARMIVETDDRFSKFFIMKASPTRKPAPAAPGFAELLAYAQAEEAHTHAIVAQSSSDPLKWECQYQHYYERMQAAFPEIVAKFPLPTQQEVDEHNADLLEQHPESGTRNAYELWSWNEDFDCALNEHMTALRHAALRASGGTVLIIEEDETNG